MAGIKKQKTVPAAGRKILLMMSALMIVAGASVTVNAADTDPITGKKGVKNSDTQVYLGVAKANPADVSFEVPLYYTMAVVGADPAFNNGSNSRVVKPLNYEIKNTTYKTETRKDENGNLVEKPMDYPKLDSNGNLIRGEIATELAVVAVRVRKAENSTWSLVSAFDPADGATDRKLKMSIGGLKLPDLSDLQDREFKSADITAEDSVFYDKKADRFQIIGDYDGDGAHDREEASMKLDVDVEISPSYVPVDVKTNPNDPSAVALFQVIYTLSPLDDKGQPIAKYDQFWVDEHYDGPRNEKGNTKTQP